MYGRMNFLPVQERYKILDLTRGLFSQVWTSNNPLGKPCVYILAGMLPNLILFDSSDSGWKPCSR